MCKDQLLKNRASCHGWRRVEEAKLSVKIRVVTNNKSWAAEVKVFQTRMFFPLCNIPSCISDLCCTWFRKTCADDRIETLVAF
jgi:hypothetical protein